MTNAEIMKIGVEQNQYPRHLLKYRSENTNTQKIITQNELYFSNPLDFNDPFDCNTPINTNTSLEDIKLWLNSTGVFPQFIDEYAEKLQNNPNLMKEETEKAMSKTGICCFSTLEDNILQWSHYADYHRGICLKFDITEDPDFFMTPIIVAYRQVMQHYNHFCHQNSIIEYLIKPKYHEWSYESEIRIVKPDQIMQKNGGKRTFKFKDKALKEIIFGIKTPDNIISKYRQLCLNNNKEHVVFSKMELGKGTHYALNKIQI